MVLSNVLSTVPSSEPTPVQWILYSAEVPVDIVDAVDEDRPVDSYLWCSRDIRSFWFPGASPLDIDEGGDLGVTFYDDGDNDGGSAG